MREQYYGVDGEQAAYTRHVPAMPSIACRAGRAGRCVAVAAVLTVVWPLYAHDTSQWPDTYVARLEALALIQTLNAEILASRSATLVLENWCREHRLAAETRIVARLVAGVSKVPTAEQRRRLEVAEHDEIRYRRVELRCGDRVLSDADNWYVPGRLTAEMNRLLETTDAPFGAVIAPLEPYRRTFAVNGWRPLPDGWERDAGKLPIETGGTLAIPDVVLEHRAVVYDGRHRAISEVWEAYSRQMLTFPRR